MGLVASLHYPSLGACLLDLRARIVISRGQAEQILKVRGEKQIDPMQPALGKSLAEDVEPYTPTSGTGRSRTSRSRRRRARYAS